MKVYVNSFHLSLLLSRIANAASLTTALRFLLNQFLNLILKYTRPHTTAIKITHCMMFQKLSNLGKVQELPVELLLVLVELVELWESVGVVVFESVVYRTKPY